MSHHFDTPTALEDPRINVCDFYLFARTPGTTVMAMTVNPDAGISAPDVFREEGLYAFRFDTKGDAREDVTFKLRFGAPRHPEDGHHEDDAHIHVQSLEVRRATGDDAGAGAAGDLLLEGHTGAVVSAGGVRVFAGLAPDLFAGDGAALGRFRKALQDGRYDAAAFQSRKNLFATRNVTAIVLEVPTALIGHGRVQAWATASLHGHAPEMQVSRWGLPLVTNMLMPDPSMKEAFNRAPPTTDRELFAAPIAGLIEKIVGLAGSAPDPAVYAGAVAARLTPAVLPYELGTPAAFTIATFNGRALADDVMDVILTLATNTALGDGVAPDASRITAAFPYFGAPYTAAEQSGLAPMGPARKSHA